MRADIKRLLRASEGDTPSLARRVPLASIEG